MLSYFEFQYVRKCKNFNFIKEMFNYFRKFAYKKVSLFFTQSIYNYIFIKARKSFLSSIKGHPHILLLKLFYYNLNIIFCDINVCSNIVHIYL